MWFVQLAKLQMWANVVHHTWCNLIIHNMNTVHVFVVTQLLHLRLDLALSPAFQMLHAETQEAPEDEARLHSDFMIACCIILWQAQMYLGNQ